MSISFSGLASGLDTSSWVTSLTALKQAKVTTLEAQKTAIVTCQEALTNIKSYFSSFRSTIEKIADSRLSCSTDLFAQNIATSANLGVLTATASTDALEGTYDIKVDRLASSTKATSAYRYKTTIVETTTAVSDSKLTDLSYTDGGTTKFIQTGTIGVTVNGVEHGVSITSTDTIGSFVEKMKNIGVSAYYNEDTGIFTINSSVEYIRDNADGNGKTGIVDALHLTGVNEGYKTNYDLEVKNVETVYKNAEKNTTLSELGVVGGKLAIQANGITYEGSEALDIDYGDSIQDLIDKLAGINVHADLVDGVFTIDDAEILSSSTTNLAEVFGFENTVISQNTQGSSQLSYSIKVTDTTVVSEGTKLSELINPATNEYVTVADNSTFTVVNSDNTTNTITVSGDTTMGQLIGKLKTAGLSANLSNDGVLIVSGGTIQDNDGTGTNFDIVDILGLSSQADTAMAVGNSLTEKIDYVDIAKLDTKLVEDFKITENSKIQVINGSNETTTITVTSGMTVQGFMGELNTRGISADFDESTGILTITGGQYSEVTGNALEKLFGNSTIPSDNITTASTSATSAQLKYTVTNTIQATTATTLGTLGLTAGQSTATFNVRGETRTVTVNSSMSISSFLSTMTSAGISATFDESTSKITIENAELTSGTTAGTLGGALGLSQTTTSKFVQSDKMYKVCTTNVNSTGATLQTVVNNVADYNTKFSDLNITVAAELTTTVYNSGGTAVKTITMASTDDMTAFFKKLEDEGITASISNGVITMSSSTNKYISDTSGLAAKLGISASAYTYVSKTEQKSTAAVQFTDTYTATREQTLGDVSILTSGTAMIRVKDDNGNTVGMVTVNPTTSIGDMIDDFAELDFYISFSDGHIQFNSTNGYTVENIILENNIIDKINNDNLSYTDTRNVASSTQLSKFGVQNGELKIHKDDGTYKTITVSNTSTLGSFLSTLQENDFSVNIDNGTITITGTGETYLETVSGGTDIVSKLKLGTRTDTNATIHTNTNSNAQSYNTTVSASKDIALQDLKNTDGTGAVTFAGNNVVLSVTATSTSGNQSTVSLTFSKTSTLNDVFNRLSNLGIDAVIDSSGQISFSSNTLTDFNLTGDLATALCGGSCTRSYGTVTQAATSSAKLNQLTKSSGTNLGITSGNIAVYQNGTKNIVSIDNTSTLETLASRLSQYGISMQVSTDGTIYFTGSGDSYLAEESGGSNLLTKLNVKDNWTATTKSQSRELNYTETPNVYISSDNPDVKLSQLKNSSGTSLGITAGTFDVYTNGVKSTKTITADTTVGDFLSMLSSAGMTVDISSDGKISVGAQNNTYATGNVIDKLFTSGWNYTKIYTSNEMEMERTEDEAITRDTKLADINGTTYQEGTITIVRNGVVSNLSLTADETVGTLMDRLELYGFDSSISVNGQLVIRNTGDSYLKEYTGTGTASNALDILGVDYSDSDWITTNSYESTENKNTVKYSTVQTVVTRDTLISHLGETGVDGLDGVTTGEYYIYRNGVKYTAMISTDTTVGDFLDTLNSYGLTASLVQYNNGTKDDRTDDYSVIKILGDGNSYIAKSSSTDTNIASNVVEKLGLTTVDSVYDYSGLIQTSDREVTYAAATEDTLVSTYDRHTFTDTNITTVTPQVTVTDATSLASALSSCTTIGIANADVLAQLATLVNSGTSCSGKTIVLTDDIDLSEYHSDTGWTAIGTSSNSFEGTFDGQGHVISNLYINNSAADDNLGLFGVVQGTIQNVGVENCDISTDQFAGALAGELDNGSICNCYTTGVVRGVGDFKSCVGGLAGVVNGGTITSCYSTADVEGGDDIGGLIGWTMETTVSNCYATGDVEGENNIGGLIGYANDKTTVSNCYATGDVKGDDCVGGLIGLTDSGWNTIKNSTSYATLVSATTDAGSLVGWVSYGPTISSCSCVNISGVNKVGGTSSYDSKISYVSASDAPAENIKKSEGKLSITVDGLTNYMSISATETIGTLLGKFRDLGMEATLSDSGEILIESGFKDITINETGTTSNILTNLGLKFNSDFGGYAASSVTVTATVTTIEDKTVSAANYAQGDTKVSLCNISAGSLSLFRNGERKVLTIDENDTFNSLNTKLDGQFSDIDLVFEDGYLQFRSTDESVVVDIGSTTDTSNFVAICGMTATGENYVESSRKIYQVSGESKLMTDGLFKYGSVTAGNFTIGNATFEIDEDTTLNNIISQINSSDAANATAYWDSVDGKLVVKSRSTGGSMINIEAGTSNFTHALGLTTSDTVIDDEGNSVQISKVVKDSQEVGENAKFSINGTYYTSTKNTVESDVSRLQGVTLNLKDVSEGESVKLTIEKDKETLSNAVSEVVDAYNELITNVDTELATTGNLSDQSTLKMIRNQLRNLMTSSISGSAVYKNLMSVGITTSSATAGSISTSGVNTLTFDADKFMEAFDADADAVKSLLIGEDSSTGIFLQLDDILERQLGTTGYFTTANNSYNKQISAIEKKIDNATTAVSRYQSRLESSFSSMDLLIANMQNQYSAFLSS